MRRAGRGSIKRVALVSGAFLLALAACEMKSTVNELASLPLSVSVDESCSHNNPVLPEPHVHCADVSWNLSSQESTKRIVVVAKSKDNNDAILYDGNSLVGSAIHSFTGKSALEVTLTPYTDKGASKPVGIQVTPPEDIVASSKEVYSETHSPNRLYAVSLENEETKQRPVRLFLKPNSKILSNGGLVYINVDQLIAYPGSEVRTSSPEKWVSPQSIQIQAAHARGELKVVVDITGAALERDQQPPLIEFQLNNSKGFKLSPVLIQGEETSFYNYDRIFRIKLDGENQTFCDGKLVPGSTATGVYRMNESSFVSGGGGNATHFLVEGEMMLSYLTVVERPGERTLFNRIGWWRFLDSRDGCRIDGKTIYLNEHENEKVIRDWRSGLPVDASGVSEPYDLVLLNKILQKTMEVKKSLWAEGIGLDFELAGYFYVDGSPKGQFAALEEIQKNAKVFAKFLKQKKLGILKVTTKPYPRFFTQGAVLLLPPNPDLGSGNFIHDLLAGRILIDRDVEKPLERMLEGIGYHNYW